MVLTPQQEAEAFRMTLAYAKERWPNANRVTHPELMRDIDETRARLRALERSGERDGGKP